MKYVIDNLNIRIKKYIKSYEKNALMIELQNMFDLMLALNMSDDKINKYLNSIKNSLCIVEEELNKVENIKYKVDKIS